MVGSVDDYPRTHGAREAGGPPPDDGHWPVVHAASAILFRERFVLLVERGTGPNAGRWSLPGGHVETGETAEAAARREVREETGIEAGELRMLDVHTVEVTDSLGVPVARYRIDVFYGWSEVGEPVASDDARDARFITPDDLAQLPLTGGAEELIRRAWAVVSAEG